MIFCISILEHVGMDNSVYGNKNEEDYKSQLKALNEIYRITKIGGKVILTLPFGKFMNYKWFLQYDFNLLKLLTLQSNFKTMNIQFYRVVNNSWIFSRYYSCSDITYHSKESRAGAVVCVVLQK
jgi:O-antigen chain-terminating methyltransferase